ncbi:MAG: adenylate/guanylate cyclase domain-containing protein [Thermodesulfobacteriota bacterium]
MAIADPKIPPLTRKITVVFTDIVASSLFFKTYGNLAGRRMLEEHNKMLIPIIKEHSGLVVKTVGDSIMAYFLNPAEAIKSAVKMQKRLTQFNLNQPPDHEIRIRIAVHYGDGLIEKEDIFGDVVNVAAKILPLAESDTIYVTEEVRLIIGNGLPLHYEEVSPGDDSDLPGQRVYRVLWEDDLDLLPVTNIIILVNPVPFLGEKAFGKKWPFFLQAVYSYLNEGATETRVLENKMIFSCYDNLPETLSRLLDLLVALRGKYLMETPLESLPLQIILHKDTTNCNDDSFVGALSIGWENLKPDVVYLTKPAYDSWLENRPGDCDFKLVPHGKDIYRVETDVAGLIEDRVLFPHREIMALGNRRECFYCGSRRHHLNACPSKNLQLPARALTQIGHLSLDRVSRCFSRAFNNPEQYNEGLANLKESDLQFISEQNEAQVAYHAFFDLMEIYQLRFVRRVWRAEVTGWNRFLGAESGQKEEGGTLWLAMDCLRVGQLEKTEYFLKASEDKSGRDYRLYMLKGFLHLEKENHYEALYQFERARELSNNPLQRIYTLFLVARIHEILEDYGKAEEMINSIIFLEPQCIEAHYRKVALLTKMGLYDSAMSRLKNIILQQKDFFLSALIDPQLLSMQRILEPLLAGMLEESRLSAAEAVQQAETAINVLDDWLEKEEEAYKENRALADKMRQFMAQDSYLGYTEAEDIARTLASRCRQVLINMRAGLHKIILLYGHQIKGYELYWKAYPLKGLFKGVEPRLQQIREKLNYAEALARRDEAGLFKRARTLVDEMTSELKEMLSIVHKMELMENLFRNLRQFGKRVLILEAVVLILGIAVYPVILFYVNRLYPVFEWNTFNDLWQHQKGVLFIGGIAGFLTAVALTFKDIWRD